MPNRMNPVDMLRFPRMDSTVTLTPMAKATALTTRRTRGWRGFLPSPLGAALPISSSTEIPKTWANLGMEWTSGRERSVSHS